MPEPMKPVTAWAVVSPDGAVRLITLRENVAVGFMVGTERLARVQITEGDGLMQAATMALEWMEHAVCCGDDPQWKQSGENIIARLRAVVPAPPQSAEGPDK